VLLLLAIRLQLLLLVVVLLLLPRVVVEMLQVWKLQSGCAS
jgi:hypothetical protein